MKPEDRKKLLLSDTAVPDLFISDYMSSLTGSAVQAYLYLLMVQGNGYGVGEKEIASRLSLSPEEAKTFGLIDNVWDKRVVPETEA